jgi:hypothetical protein
MSNANDAPWERVEHYYSGGFNGRVACGKSRHVSSTCNRAQVDCKRCLASLAKRDRAFQRKARQSMKAIRLRMCCAGLAFRVPRMPTDAAARAIAAEEWRAS